MTDFTEGQTVYLTDGREASYVIKNGDSHLVRIIYEVEGGYDEPPYSYPSETITTTHAVYATPPVEVWDKEVIAKRDKISELDREIADKRREIHEAEAAKRKIETAAAKYPSIQQALDFIEGRITHIVKWSGHCAATITTMQEAFEDVDTWGGRRTVDGMKLLCLFGTDRNGKQTGWGLNRYRDGSGSGWEYIIPAKSEEEARAVLSGLLDDAFAAWRSGDANWRTDHPDVNATLKVNDWLTAPDDWIKATAEIEAKRRQDQIDKLRAELEALEAKQ